MRKHSHREPKPPRQRRQFKLQAEEQPNLAEQIRKVLRDHIGSQSPIKGKAIAQILGRNYGVVRNCIREMRLHHERIASGPYGYYMARNQDGMEPVLSVIESQIAALAKLRKQIRSQQPRLDSGQLQLPVAAIPARMQTP
jgi:hypothetical protein